jgi:hypothetical protein
MGNGFRHQSLNICHVRGNSGEYIADFPLCKKIQRDSLEMFKQVFSHFKQDSGGIQRVNIAVAYPDDKADDKQGNQGDQKRYQYLGLTADENFVYQYFGKIGLDHSQSRADAAEQKRENQDSPVRTEIFADVLNLF